MQLLDEDDLDHLDQRCDCVINADLLLRPSLYFIRHFCLLTELIFHVFPELLDCDGGLRREFALASVLNCHQGLRRKDIILDAHLFFVKFTSAIWIWQLPYQRDEQYKDE